MRRRPQSLRSNLLSTVVCVTLSSRTKLLPDTPEPKLSPGKSKSWAVRGPRAAPLKFAAATAASSRDAVDQLSQPLPRHRSKPRRTASQPRFIAGSLNPAIPNSSARAGPANGGRRTASKPRRVDHGHYAAFAPVDPDSPHITSVACFETPSPPRSRRSPDRSHAGARARRPRTNRRESLGRDAGAAAPSVLRGLAEAVALVRSSSPEPVYSYIMPTQVFPLALALWALVGWGRSKSSDSLHRGLLHGTLRCVRLAGFTEQTKPTVAPTVSARLRDATDRLRSGASSPLLYSRLASADLWAAGRAGADATDRERARRVGRADRFLSRSPSPPTNMSMGDKPPQGTSSQSPPFYTYQLPAAIGSSDQHPGNHRQCGAPSPTEPASLLEDPPSEHSSVPAPPTICLASVVCAGDTTAAYPPPGVNTSTTAAHAGGQTYPPSAVSCPRAVVTSPPRPASASSPATTAQPIAILGSPLYVPLGTPVAGKPVPQEADQELLIQQATDALTEARRVLGTILSSPQAMVASSSSGPASATLDGSTLTAFMTPLSPIPTTSPEARSKASLRLPVTSPQADMLGLSPGEPCSADMPTPKRDPTTIPRDASLQSPELASPAQSGIVEGDRLVAGSLAVSTVHPSEGTNWIRHTLAPSSPLPCPTVVTEPILKPGHANTPQDTTCLPRPTPSGAIPARAAVPPVPPRKCTSSLKPKAANTTLSDQAVPPSAASCTDSVHSSITPTALCFTSTTDKTPLLSPSGMLPMADPLQERSPGAPNTLTPMPTTAAVSQTPSPDPVTLPPPQHSSPTVRHSSPTPPSHLCTTPKQSSRALDVLAATERVEVFVEVLPVRTGGADALVLDDPASAPEKIVVAEVSAVTTPATSSKSSHLTGHNQDQRKSLLAHHTEQPLPYAQALPMHSPPLSSPPNRTSPPIRSYYLQESFPARYCQDPDRSNWAAYGAQTRSRSAPDHPWLTHVHGHLSAPGPQRILLPRQRPQAISRRHSSVATPQSTTMNPPSPIAYASTSLQLEHTPHSTPNDSTLCAPVHPSSPQLRPPSPRSPLGFGFLPTSNASPSPSPPRVSYCLTTLSQSPSIQTSASLPPQQSARHVSSPTQHSVVSNHQRAPQSASAPCRQSLPPPWVTAHHQRAPDTCVVLSTSPTRPDSHRQSLQTSHLPVPPPWVTDNGAQGVPPACVPPSPLCPQALPVAAAQLIKHVSPSPAPEYPFRSKSRSPSQS
eukprot:gene1797-459_t